MPHRVCKEASSYFFSKRKSSMQYTFQVQGMSCAHCERAVTQALQQVDPQASVQIDRAQGKVEVHSSAPRDTLAAAISEDGYTVAPADQ